jgi:hypothetical protein
MMFGALKVSPTLKTEAVGSSETLVSIKLQRHIPEYRNLDTHRRESLESRKMLF